ncbi:CRP1 [Symbiodinium necroappetens]|uniref:CRP1 protein n=1 Tax=Symbiodinium necroappetens TaxID=1628268 RepID=A0A812ZKR2_9DINO|nr:CRP1 [Symbiodinium necroappetens]
MIGQATPQSHHAWPAWPEARGRLVQRRAALQELMDVFESDSDASQAIMTAASERGQWREVLLLHRRLLQSVEEAAPEQVGEVFANAASGLMRARQWQRALGLITEFRAQCRDSLTFWSVAHTAERSSSDRSDRVPMFQLLLSMFSNFGTWDQVLWLLQEARRCPEAVTTTDIASVMTALTNQKRWRMSLRVFAESRDSVGADARIYKSAYQAWSSGHHWQQVISLLAEEQAMRGEDQGVDGAMRALCQATVSLLKMRSSSSKASSTSAALAASRMLADMRLRKLSPPMRLYSQAVAANARAGDPDQALQLIRQMREEALPQTPQMHLSCMRAFQAACHWEQALVLLKEEVSRDDAASFEEGIFACSGGGKWQLATEVLNEMQARQLPVKGVTYATLISACVRAKQWRYALWFLHEMERTGADKSEKNKVILYGGVITTFNWQRALWLLREMPAREVLPNVVAYGAVASVCNRARKYLYSLQLHEEMQEKDQGTWDNDVGMPVS